MKKKVTIVTLSLIVLMIITSVTLVIAAPNIKLTTSASGNNISFSWTNSDTVKSYNYDVKKSVNGAAYTSLNENDGNKIKVLNVYTDSASVDQNVTINTYDGESLTIKKSAILKQWMESPNSEDSRGYGRGLIEVTPVSITDFNANPSAYLYKSNGKYNYQIVVFGTWDGYGGQDISDSARNIMNTYLAEGNSCVMGHDTVRGDTSRAPNLASLRGYFNIKTVEDDGVTDSTGVNPGNINGGNTNATTQVTLRTNNVFTTYPWYIGSAGTQLTVPHCHCVQQVAYGNVEITFSSVGDLRDQNGQGNWNYYLTVHNNTAMIQTGHSSGESTADEQKIWANLLFYLGDANTSTTATETKFVDINAPNIPSIGTNNLSGVNGTVSYSATDNGTTYKYYVEATERVSLEKTTSNTVTHVRTTGVAGYSYVIDTNASTNVDGTIDTTSTSIKYTLGNGPKTYLHIRAIDGAGNAGPIQHVLLHTNVAPTLSVSQNITIWTNKDVVLTATGADTDGRVVSVKKPDNSVANAASTTYTVGQNGTYTFVATDNSGATATKSITITNIDKVEPEGYTTGTTQPTATNRYAVINFKATDDASGVAKIVKPDGTEVKIATQEQLEATTTYNVTVPGDYTFTVHDHAGNSTTVTIPVTIVSDGLEVKFIDQVTKAEIATKKTGAGNVGQAYTTSPENVEGYQLVLIPNNASGSLTMDKIIVTYEYRKNSNVIAKYIDENYNTNIVNDVISLYKEGDPYTTEEKSFTGYQLTGKTDNTSGTVVRDDITVIYRYKKISQGIEVRFIDQVTKQEIADRVTETGLEKDDYKTTAKEIEDYELMVTPDNANGKMAVDKIIITYEYRNKSNVTTKYIDENYGTKILDDIVIEYLEEDDYSTEQKTIDGYQLTSKTNNTAGTIARQDIVVEYRYKKISAGVDTRFID